MVGWGQVVDGSRLPLFIPQPRQQAGICRFIGAVVCATVLEETARRNGCVTPMHVDMFRAYTAARSARAGVVDEKRSPERPISYTVAGKVTDGPK